MKFMQNLKRYAGGSYRLTKETEEQASRYDTAFKGALNRLTGDVKHVVFGYITAEDEYVLAGENSKKYRMFSNDAKYNDYLIELKSDNSEVRNALCVHASISKDGYEAANNEND